MFGFRRKIKIPEREYQTSAGITLKCPDIRVPLESEFVHRKGEDGYYHLTIEELQHKGYLCDTKMFYRFDAPIILEGNIPDNAKIEVRGHHPSKCDFLLMGTPKNRISIGRDAVIEVSDGICMQRVDVDTRAYVRATGIISMDLCSTREGSKIYTIFKPINIQDSNIDGLIVTGSNLLGSGSRIKESNVEIRNDRSIVFEQTEFDKKVIRRLNGLGKARWRVGRDKDGAKAYVTFEQVCNPAAVVSHVSRLFKTPLPEVADTPDGVELPRAMFTETNMGRLGLLDIRKYLKEPKSNDERAR